MVEEYNYGLYSMYPPVDPTLSMSNFKKHMQKHSELTCGKWRELNGLVIAHEREIQDAVLKLSEEKDSHHIEALLKKAWRTTRDDYNKHQATEPQGILPGFRLDPNGEISNSHASDLDNFNLDFLNIVEGGECITYYPFYRNGANYLDDPYMLHTDHPWPDVPEPPRQVGTKVAYNIDVRKHAERVRASYLVPHINLADLTNPLNLVTFIHHRARLTPHKFARLDSDLMHVGKMSHILAGAYTPFTMISSSDDHLFDSRPHLGITTWTGSRDRHFDAKTKDEINHFRDMYDAGHVTGTIDAWLVMQSQAIAYSFLSNLCKDLIPLARAQIPSEALPKLTETQALQRIKVLKPYAGPEQWQDLPSLRQYEPLPDRLDIDRFLPTLESKMEEAETHLSRIFDEPDYFLEAVMDQKRHHPSNLNVDYGDTPGKHMAAYDRKHMRQELYYDLVRSVLRRAVFGAFIWSLVKDNLLLFEATSQWGPDDLVSAYLDQIAEETEKTTEEEEQASKPKENELRDIFISNVQRLSYVIRYCALLFLKEFSSKLMHASYEPMQQLYSRISRPTDLDLSEPKPVDPDKPHVKDIKRTTLPRGLYTAGDSCAQPTRTTLHVEHDDLQLIVGELINNFIANYKVSLFVGVRKATARLQRYLDDCDDDETSRIFTPLVADTIDSLDVLAEIAQYVSDFCGLSAQIESHFEEMVSAGCHNFSIDLLAFDEFPYEGAGRIPGKRLERIVKFLEEAQGFDTKVTITIGQARGDLKRIGASLLCRMIVPMNKETYNRATDDRLRRLEEIMGVRRDQYPFDPKEKPIDLDIEDKIARRVPLTTWRGVNKALKKETLRRRKERKERNQQTDKTFNQPVLDEIRRRKLLKDRQDKENDRRRRLQLRRKGRWNRRQAEAAQAGNTEDDDAMDNEAEEDLVEAVHQFDIQAQASMPQTPPQQHVLPPPRASNLAPDDMPKAPLNKRIWKTLGAVFGIDDDRVSWEALVRAMNTLGYREQGRGGSHGVFLRTSACRWPEGVLAKGRNIQLARNHEGGHSGAARGKTKDWGMRLGQRGLTWDFICEWCQLK
ncbi:hypothetical protein EDB81DRAFT_635723 [Dactylonectria macrodidyma]|uniref:Uncharacterized protein n=1 Tax=Dactylonectria macrodidyma TaxID=307937 RepID=A0A9P9JMB1_9HYPO|nr:hypothetical protein EDB81DRAFT_635723 [Dactylonectria macrodidyma]